MSTSIKKQHIEQGRGRSKISKANVVSSKQIASLEAIINDDTRRYGIKIKFTKAPNFKSLISLDNNHSILHQITELNSSLEELENFFMATDTTTSATKKTPTANNSSFTSLRHMLEDQQQMLK